MASFRKKIAKYFLGEDFFDRIDKVKTPDKPRTENSQVAGFDGGIYGFRAPGIDQEEYIQNIKGWVYAAINCIAEQIAAIDLTLFKLKDNKKDVEEVTGNSPIIDSLYQVNEYTTKYDHFWLTAAYLEAVGEAPWFLDKDGGGNILGIYLLNPKNVKPIPDPKNKRLIGGYAFTLDRGNTVIIPVDQLIMLKYPDPNNPIRGKGTMWAAAKTIDVENEAENWNFQFFKNNATPGTVIKINTKSLTAEQRRRIKQKAEDQYKGVEKSQRLWVLFDDMEVTPYGNIQKDMEFSEQQKFTKEKILSIFRVPPVMLGAVDVATYASAKAAIEVFQKTVILPKMERIIEQLNEFFVSQFPDSEKIYLDYIPPIEDDMVMKLQVYGSALTYGWMTLNEVRAAEGLESYGPKGDVAYIPFSLMPLSVQTNAKTIKASRNRLRELGIREKPVIDKDTIRKELKQMIKQNIIKKLNDKKKNEAPDSVQTERPQWSAEQKEAFWRIKDAVSNRYMPKFVEKMNDTFDRQKQYVLSQLKNSKDIKVNIGSVLLKKKKEAAKALSVFVPIIKLLIKDSSDQTFAALNVDMELNLEDEAIKNYMNSRTVKFSDAATETTNEQIKATLEEAIKLGESIDAMSKRVADVFDQDKDYRSERIARSEVIRFNSEATEQAFIESGVVEAKEWIVNPGACDSCLQLKGKTVDLGNSFADKGDKVGNVEVEYETVEHPPLHVNCRCDLAPVLTSNKVYADETGKVWKSVIKMKKMAKEKI